MQRDAYHKESRSLAVNAVYRRAHGGLQGAPALNQPRLRNEQERACAEPIRTLREKRSTGWGNVTVKQ